MALFYRIAHIFRAFQVLYLLFDDIYNTEYSLFGIKNRANTPEGEILYMSFEALGLSDNLMKAIDECGYTEPTPIQAAAIPAVLMMRDVVGLAQTGTGKTAGFTLPMIEILDGGRAKARMPRSLILTPTRELAAQVAQNFDTYGKYTNLSKALLVGGVNMDPQIKALERGVDVLIATPGRLLDLFDRGNILLSDIKIFVIDEADRMMDMGFIPDIEKIASLLPFTRQTLLFSATMAPEIKKLTEKFLSNPKEVSVAPPATTATNVEQFLVETSPRDKKKVLDKLLKQEDVKNAFIFCNRKRDVDDLAAWLKGKGYKAEPMHGDMPQKTRTETLAGFKSGEIELLVCSDVAARGIDIDAVSHVFNYDVPMNADDYVHRIGRTARAGQKGRAWMLSTDRDAKYLDAVEKRIKQDIERVLLDGGSKPEDKKRSKPKTDHSKDPAPRSSVRSDKRADKSANEKPKNDVSPKKKRRYQDDDDGDSGTGFGDDVPAFFKI